MRHPVLYCNEDIAISGPFTEYTCHPCCKVDFLSTFVGSYRAHSLSAKNLQSSIKTCVAVLPSLRG